MKLYTRRGDDGTTRFFGGEQVLKSHLRVHTYGEVDEVNATIGGVIACGTDGQICQRLLRIQSDLLTLGAELATPSGNGSAVTIEQAHVTQLERWIDEASDEVAPLQNFILPGGCELAARLHAARAVCRRAERAVVGLAQQESVTALAIMYLNRLSDLLFALARLANHRAGVCDVEWVTRKK